ncbi:MAG: hypothetical protein R3E95_05065 [Thiolinea sp.]
MCRRDVGSDVPPGMNVYVSAVMYGRAVNLAASAFLLATTLSVLSISLWLYLLVILCCEQA